MFNSGAKIIKTRKTTKTNSKKIIRLKGREGAGHLYVPFNVLTVKA